MDITLLIESFIGLIIILAGLMFVLFYSPSAKIKRAKKKLSKTVPDIKKQKIDLDSLRAIIKNKKTTSTELKEALDLVLKYYGNIHSDFDIYMEMLIVICRHPNTNKNIIIDFDKELLKLNPQYKAEINDAITKGLNSRGI